jgi:hypothetical protein
MLCCVIVLCCVVPCCAVLCRVVLCDGCGVTCDLWWVCSVNNFPVFGSVRVEHQPARNTYHISRLFGTGQALVDVARCVYGSFSVLPVTGVASDAEDSLFAAAAEAQAEWTPLPDVPDAPDVTILYHTMDRSTRGAALRCAVLWASVSGRRF